MIPAALSPPMRRLRIVILGLSITSSWGNGHATTYRGLVRELERRGHDVLFLEHDKPWYASNRDMPQPPYGRTCLYTSVHDPPGTPSISSASSRTARLPAGIQRGFGAPCPCVVVSRRRPYQLRP